MAIRQANLTLYRKYPDRLRLELERNGTTEMMGFDHSQVWKSGSASLSEAEGRDIRAMLRMWPERLFTSRGEGARYREAGTRIEDDETQRNLPPPSPETAKANSPSAIVFDQVEMEDSLGATPTDKRGIDQRRIYYYVNRDTATVTASRWLEPDDPRQSVDDANLSATDMRVNFSAYSESSGVLWPMEITYVKGGRKFFRLRLSEVKINQPLNDTIFQRP